VGVEYVDFFGGACGGAEAGHGSLWFFVWGGEIFLVSMPFF
jgi:hypothetical protein